MRSILIKTFFIATLLGTPAINLYSQTFVKYLGQGNQCYQNADYQNADIAFTQALELNSESIPARVGRAYSRFKMNDFEGAIIDLTVLIDHDPKNLQALIYRAKAYQALDKPMGACSDISDAFSIAPENKDVVAMMSQNCDDLAIIQYEVDKHTQRNFIKGQFETTEMFNARVSASIDAVRDSLIREYAMRKINMELFELESYDADQEIYTIIHPQYDTIFLLIPLSNAKKLYETWTGKNIKDPGFLFSYGRSLLIEQFSLEIAEMEYQYNFHEDQNLYVVADMNPTSTVYTPGNISESKTGNKSLALVIGNSDYQFGGALLNPINDARAISESLSDVGFEVMKYENLELDKMRKVIDEFGMELRDYDIGLFFYAGHGIQAKGNNYLIPVDADINTENDVQYSCVNAGRILGEMEDARNNTNIIILDACRDNPFERSWTRSGKGRGLAYMNAPAGSIIAYATAPGSTASDGLGTNGLYTAGIIKYMNTPNLSILQVFQRVRKYVREQSGGQQIPWESTSLEGDLYLIAD